MRHLINSDGYFAVKNNMNETSSKDRVENIRDAFKRWPRLYFFIATVFGPLMFCGLSGKGFLKKYGSEGVCLNLGSGPRVIGEEVVNVDMYPYKGVSVIADITALPFKDGSVSRIVCDTVLEHVHPFHSSPSDYQRWTYGGLLHLTRDFETVEGGNRAGPFSALTVWLCYFFASAFSFGSKSLYWVLINMAMFIFFPIKLLDIVGNHLPQATNMAAVLYVVIRKK